MSRFNNLARRAANFGGSVKQVRNSLIGIARDEIFGLSGLGIEHMALYRANIGTINMDAD